MAADLPRRGIPATHPGELLREQILPALKAEGVAKLRVAEHIGVTRQALENLVKEKAAVTPEMALRLAAAFGNSPEFWLNLQAQWDLDQARAAIAGELAKIKPLKAA